MSFEKITVQALVSAGPEKVWTYWTRPEHMIKWNFASDDWHCPAAENDLRPGGKMKSRMEARDGSFGFDFEAIYDQVIDQRKIVYTMGDGRHASTDFEPENEKTKITIVFDAENQNPLAMQKAGWQAILDNFKKYTENN
jgi:uncharacterized protein YndB with AHSA1/START domain